MKISTNFFAGKIITLGFFSMFYLLSPLYAQAISGSMGSFIKNAEFRHTETLIKIYNDQSVSRKARILAAEKIIELISANQAEPDKYTDKILAGIESGISDSIKEIRLYSCHLLDKLGSVPKSDKAYALLKNLLTKESSPEIAAACSRALGKYIKQAPDATDILTAKLDLFLSQPRSEKAEIAYLKSVIDSLGQLKQKKAYLPLMKIMQSQYADEVKKAAESALEKIPMG